MSLTKKELILKWITALRSGKYKQEHGRLKSLDNEFCCLGVLCDVYDSERWKHLGSDKNYYRWGQFPYQSGGADYINSEFLESIVGNYKSFTYQNDGSHQKHLSEMNDEGSSFDEIADYIEKNILSTVNE